MITIADKVQEIIALEEKHGKEATFDTLVKNFGRAIADAVVEARIELSNSDSDDEDDFNNYRYSFNDDEDDDDELVDPPEFDSPDAQVNDGNKNSPMQDVDEMDNLHYNIPINSKHKAVLETAGITASSILADSPESVKPAVERDVLMDEKNLITTKEAFSTDHAHTSHAENDFPPISHSENKMSKINYLDASGVAKIIGVTKRTVNYWRAKGLFTEDLLDHKGIYLYSVERVMQLKDVYRKDWMKGGYSANDNCDVLRPSITDADIAAIKSMSAKARRELKIKINQLDLRFILPLDRQNKGFICPMCGNGSGRSGDGITPKIDDSGEYWYFYYHCFSHRDFEGKLTKIIEKINNTDDYNKVLAIGQKLLEMAAGSEIKPSTFKPAQQRDFTDEEKALFKSDINSAANHINDLPVEDRRGITLETYQHFHCGYLVDFVLYSKRNDAKKIPSRRIIIPVTECYYNAILTNSARREYERRGYFDYPKTLMTGNKEIFNAADIVPNKIIIVVEGEINAMSIWQASGVNVIATGGASNYKKLITLIINKFNPADLSFVVLFDNDSTGISKAQELTDALTKIGCPAISDFLSTDAAKIDANDILTSQGGDALKAIIDKIISDAQINLAELRKNISDRQINKNQSEGLTAEQRIALFSGSFDDLDNAYRIAYLFKNELRYVRDSDIWATYDGAKWILSGDSKSSAIEPFISKLAIKLKAAAKTEKENKLAKIFRQAKKTNPAISKLKGVEEIFITQKDLNTHRHLLNCKNGVVDLETKKIYPHDSSLLLTQQVNAVYIPNFYSDVVDHFLESIMPDDETRAALLRFLGYGLTGETSEEKALFFHGEGGNGKGSLTSTVLKLFGNYGAAFPIKAILSSSQSKDSDAPTPARVKLLHTRLAIAEEIPQGKTLDAAEFKLLTGGDEIPIRRLHQEATAIENPTHKMIFSGNYLPKCRDPHDKGILRRFLIIRFTQTFDAAKCDTNLKKKLNSSDALNALLSLLVDNAAQWYKDGLIYSAAMNADKKEFFAAQDFVQDFIEDKCNFHSDGVILFSHFLNRLREYPATPAGLTDRELKAHISKTLNKLEGVEKRKSGVYKIFGLNWRVDDKDLEIAGEEVPDESVFFGY